MGSLSLLQGDLPNPGIKPRPPALPVDSLTAELQRKPKNTGVGKAEVYIKSSEPPGGTHEHHQMVRLITFFATKDGEGLYSQ